MGVKAKISIRIQIVGSKPYHRQIMSLRSDRKASSISKGKLAVTIAKELQKAMVRAHVRELVRNQTCLRVRKAAACKLHREAASRSTIYCSLNSNPPLGASIAFSCDGFVSAKDHDQTSTFPNRSVLVTVRRHAETSAFANYGAVLRGEIHHSSPRLKH
ncbi:hypothetical protein BD309DRAFT_987627 [Dichomitus squalens]|nr:hypothetical protein BD309DRAFT_987627 [Dichomitus squalens]